jgi:pyrimidine-nucleoside phosphorylase
VLNPYRIIQRKRDGEELTPREIGGFFEAYLTGTVPDYQVAAFLMAVYFRGMSGGELTALVDCLLRSGGRVDLGGVPGRKVDKHSTGGVGDKVSLALAPLVASLGVPVPMMTGRGLGHTGGTADKLESIPGFRLDLSLEGFRRQVAEIGCAFLTQTDAVAPLDGRLYALRDVTATVDSVPLIAASIMSKKIAAGIDALVLDVKMGSGALMVTREDAERLGRTMIDIGKAHGVETVVLLTAMDRPLGHAVGNALEVREALALLRGQGPPDLREVTVALAAEMLVLGGRAPDTDAARGEAGSALDDGRALDKLRAVIRAQGGDPAVVDDPGRLPQAPVRHPVEAGRGGVVTAFDVRAMGHAAVELGAGRRTLGGRVDPGVGFHLDVRLGDRVARGDRMATVHSVDAAAAEAAAAALLASISIEEGGTPDPLPLVAGRLA